MRDGVRVADIDDVGGDGVRESADYSVGLVLSPHVAIADVVDGDWMDPRRHARIPLQNSVINQRHCCLQMERERERSRVTCRRWEVLVGEGRDRGQARRRLQERKDQKLYC